MSSKTGDVVADEVVSTDHSSTKPAIPQKDQVTERLKKINDPTRQADIERFSKKEEKATEITETAEAVADEKAPQKRVGSLIGAWDAVLNASKVSINDKIDNTRKETNSPFKMTHGSGKVQSIIGEFEKLFVHKAATKEEVTASVKAASHRINQSDLIWPSSPSKSNAPETFEIGSTHVYKLDDLQSLSTDGRDMGPSIILLEKMLADNQGKPLVLSSGVYGMKEGKPAIDTTAVALQGDDGKIYIALTVNAAKNFGYNEVDDTAFGVHKISAFFAHDTPGAELLSSMQLLQREVNIVEKEHSYAASVFNNELLLGNPPALNAALADSEVNPTFGSGVDDSSTRISSPSLSTTVSEDAAQQDALASHSPPQLSNVPIVAAVGAVGAAGAVAAVAAAGSSPPRAPLKRLIAPPISPPAPVVVTSASVEESSSPDMSYSTASSASSSVNFPHDNVTTSVPTVLDDEVIEHAVKPLSAAAVPAQEIVTAPVLPVKLVEEPVNSLDVEPVHVTAAPALDQMESSPLDACSALPDAATSNITDPARDIDHVDADVDAAAGADAAVVTPQESPPPEPIQSWNPRSVMYENTLYYWDPYRGTYSLEQVEVVYDPPVLKGPFTSPPSWFSRKLKPKARQVKVEEPEPLEADDVRQIIHDDVTYEWDEVAKAYYPLNMKLDIK